MRNSFLLPCIAIILGVIISSNQLLAQTNTNKLPELTEALQKANKAKKMLFLQIQSEKCIQCNDVANMGIRAAKASIDSHCIVLNLKTIPEELKPVYNLYEIPKEYFGVLITDDSLNILSAMNSSSTAAFPYVYIIQKAIIEKKSTESFGQAKANYLMQKPNFQTSLQLTKKIIQIGFEPGNDLIEELVRKASTDSLESLSFIQYVMKLAPPVGSTALLLVTKNRDNYNMAWYRMSLRERVNINNRIASKSISKAIAEKNISYANQVAAYKQGTYNDKLEDGYKANLETMLAYYGGVNDTANYLRSVFNFYDRFFMNIQPEDIKREDSINTSKMVKIISPSEFEMLFQQLPDSIKRKIEANSKKIGSVSSKTIQYAPRVQFYANGLNEGAWKVYTYSNNQAQLNKAVLYIRKSFEFYETPESMDTYARLLYKTGNHAEAIQWEEKAIQQKRKAGFDASEYEKVIYRMKKSLSNIDADSN